MPEDQKGFTLIELTIMIVIIGIFTAALAPGEIAGSGVWLVTSPGGAPVLVGAVQTITAPVPLPILRPSSAPAGCQIW